MASSRLESSCCVRCRHQAVCAGVKSALIGQLMHAIRAHMCILLVQVQGRCEEIWAPAAPVLELNTSLVHPFNTLPIDPSILRMLQLDAEAQAQKAAEAVESHQEAASTNWVELGHSLMDYKAVCMAADACVVGISCQSDELHAVSLPGHLALWEVSTGEDNCCLVALKIRLDI